MKQDDNNSETFVQYDQEGDKIINPGTLTQEEKIYFEKARNEHRLNMTKVQKIGTKVFKGTAFIGKPEKIIFKDFDVGKPHYLTFTLTNVSNAFNSFNVLPLPLKIRNYFEVTYIPKGKISPGITCDIKFKFLPQLNEDINSEFSILAETGQIDYPMICTSKKAIVKCSNQLVNFEKVIEGEVGETKLQLQNYGALPTDIIIKLENGISLDKADEFTKQLLKQFKFSKQTKIEGYSRKNISFTFEPVSIGDSTLNLQVYFTNYQYSPPIIICLRGQCIKVPVTIQRPFYDFQICLFNHIYRQKLCFYNAGNNPMSFKVSQPQGTKKFFQFNPIIGYIQEQSKIDVWVKFSANKDLANFLMQYQIQQNVYEIPFELIVKQQVLPVNFKLKFKISKDQLVISPSQLNFGTIFQGLSSKIEVSFCNQTDLPQEILLYPLKKQIFVENDQSLFKIMPKSIVKKFITYKSKPLQDKKSNREEGTIPCKIITGNIATSQIKIQYSCQTLKPNLSIQHNKIEFKATQIDELSYASTVIKNNIHKQLVFQLFTPPYEVCGLKITPVVKTLGVNQEIQINIEYHSFFKTLNSTTLRGLQNKNKNQLIQEPKEEVEPPKQNKKDAKKEVKLNKQQQEALEAEQKKKQEDQKLKKQQQEQERLELQRNFNMQEQLGKLGGTLILIGTSQHYKWVLPIYFKKKDHPDASAEVNFIQITTTSVEKILVPDQQEIDFGQIAVGARKTKQFVIKNYGQKQILMKKQLPVFGCFSILNSLREIQHEGVFKAIVQFQPTENQKFQQKLTLYTQKSKISCILKGIGVRPDINIQPQSGLLHFGGVLLDQFAEKTFKIKNICNFQIQFILKRIGGGAMNTNGSNPIIYIPSTGNIPPNGQVEVKVLFRPDRINQNFFQKIKVFVPEQKHERFIYITGYCYPRQAYVKYFKDSRLPLNDQVSAKIEYSLDWMRIKDDDLYFGPNKKQIVLEFLKIDQRVSQPKQQCFKKKLTIGSSKLIDSKSEKPTNFQFVMPKDDRIQCDNLKGTTASGTETTVTFTYKPEPIDPLIQNIPVLAGVGQWKDIKIQLKLSGGFVKPGGVDAISFDIILRVYANQI